MSVITASRQIEVSTPAADQVFQIGSISGPSALLMVMATTLVAVSDGSPPIGAQIGVTNADGSLFFPVPSAVLNSACLQTVGTRVCVISPDLADPDGNVYNKPSKWAIKYLHGDYAGTARWKARVMFTYVR